MAIFNKVYNVHNTVLDLKIIKRKYPVARIIVLDDDFNTFQFVANCLKL